MAQIPCGPCFSLTCSQKNVSKKPFHPSCIMVYSLMHQNRQSWPKSYQKQPFNMPPLKKINFYIFNTFNFLAPRFQPLPFHASIVSNCLVFTCLCFIYTPRLSSFLTVPCLTVPFLTLPLLTSSFLTSSFLTSSFLTPSFWILFLDTCIELYYQVC